MGHIKWGNLAYVRGLVFMRLSPYEQKPFLDLVSFGFPNMIYRIVRQIPYIAPPGIAYYLTAMWAEEAYQKTLRKNPKDYENDE